MKKTMKKILIVLGIVVVLFGVMLFFDVARPANAKEEIKYGIWYVDKYGIKDTKTSSAVNHFLWRLSELTD